MTLFGPRRPSLWRKRRTRIEQAAAPAASQASWPDAARAARDALGPLPPHRREQDWDLVLEARGIPFREQWDASGLRLLVPGRRLEEAVAELLAFERENKPAPTLLNRVVRRSGPGVWLGLGIEAALFFASQNGLPGFPAPETAGGGDTGLILKGEWWRAVTALTLHADAAHLLSNLSLGSLFALLCAAETGAGVSFGLLAASGFMGNLVKALVQGPGHRFIGSSTAVFGLVGAVCAIKAVRRLRGQGGLTGDLAPLTVGFLFLALFGSGDAESGRLIDLAGHLFGFASGLALGAAAAWALGPSHAPPKTLDRLAGAAAGGLVVVAWAVAYGAGG